MTRSAIASRLPGRLRLRAQGLRTRNCNEALQADFRNWDGVVSVEGNPATGSILLCYDVARLHPQEMEARVNVQVAARLGLDAQEAAPQDLPAPAAGITLWQMNRAAKIGMLGSLAGTLLALGAGKKLHAAFGALHVALLTIHLANHRKKLLQ